ncbi:MAG: outer membrane beta-barrel protein [Proteobacteria bacterium]|nr:outer membrane beta-barrel protein [Pseudomonadota bacterium]
MKVQTRSICIAVYGIVFSILIVTAGAVHAGDTAGNNTRPPGYVFMGLGYANQNVDMQTRFARRVNGRLVEDASFNNEYTASAGGLFLGYQLPWDRFYLGGQISFDVVEGEFELAAGSSRFTNSINHAVGMAILPGVYLYKGLSVFGKLGLAYGDFDFVKSSPTSTHYNASRRLYGYTLGLGLAYDITAQFTAKMGYEQTRYRETGIDAIRGVLADKTRVEPKMNLFFLSLQYNFN